MSILVKSKNSYLRAIGQITVNMSNLEDEMASCIGFLNCSDMGANIRITAGEPFANLLRLLDVLFRYRLSNEYQLKRLKNITDALERVNQDRNTNVHGVIKFINAPPDGIIVNKYKYSKMRIGNFKIDRTPPSLATLKKLAKDIKTEKKRLFNFMTDNIILIKRHQLDVIKNDSIKNQEFQKMFGEYLQYGKNKETKIETKS